jgi:hypothetical protein
VSESVSHSVSKSAGHRMLLGFRLQKVRTEFETEGKKRISVELISLYSGGIGFKFCPEDWLS